MLCSVNYSQWNHEVWQPQYQQPCIISLHLHQPNLFTTLRTGLDYPVHSVFTVSLEESGNFWTCYYYQNDFNRVFMLEKLWDYLLSTLNPKVNQIHHEPWLVYCSHRFSEPTCVVWKYNQSDYFKISIESFDERSLLDKSIKMFTVFPSIKTRRNS